MGLALLAGDVRRSATYERGRSGEPRWKVTHARLLSFARKRSGLDWEEGQLLREAQRDSVHRQLGFASLAEYIERLFGYNGRLVKEKLRVAQSLEELPTTSEAMRTGELTWSAVRELTRVATAETERAWLEACRGLTVRQIEELVSGRAPGALPTDAADPRLRRHVLRFEVTGETRALVLEALSKVRRDAGEALDEDTALLLMARHVLGGAGNPVGEEGTRAAARGRANYQVELTICSACRRGEQVGNGEQQAVSAAAAEMSLCDAELHRDDGDETHVGPSTTQTIPRRLRSTVLRRDRRRCVVSGCKHATFVDVHHLVPQSENGRHIADNLACFCGGHHRAVHEGRLIVQGRPSTGLSFFHADGTRYGGSVQVDAAERNTQVFAALRGLGFRERDCRAALVRCTGEFAADASREEVLRAALGLLMS